GYKYNQDVDLNVPPDLSGVVGTAASYYHAIAVQSNGLVVCWGDDTSGQSTQPPGLSNVIVVAAGYYHSLAVKSDQTVVGWGRNDEQQTNIPAGLHSVVAVAAGQYHSLALIGPPAPPVLLTIASLPNGNVQLQFSSSPNLIYTVQGSTNLVNWDILGTATNSGNGIYIFEDTNVNGFRKRFYRTVSF